LTLLPYGRTTLHALRSGEASGDHASALFAKLYLALCDIT
jgi:hypothetical protein